MTNQVPYIPADAPFSGDQRAWLGGFLAGLHSRKVMGLGAAAVLGAEERIGELVEGLARSCPSAFNHLAVLLDGPSLDLANVERYCDLLREAMGGSYAGTTRDTIRFIKEEGRV